MYLKYFLPKNILSPHLLLSTFQTVSIKMFPSNTKNDYQLLVKISKELTSTKYKSIGAIPILPCGVCVHLSSSGSIKSFYY